MTFSSDAWNIHSLYFPFESFLRFPLPTQTIAHVNNFIQNSWWTDHFRWSLLIFIIFWEKIHLAYNVPFYSAIIFDNEIVFRRYSPAHLSDIDGNSRSCFKLWFSKRNFVYAWCRMHIAWIYIIRLMLFI